MEIDNEIFSTIILFLPLIQDGQVSFWQKNVHKYWLTIYRTKPAQEKSAKNIRILYIESAKTVNEMTLNELVTLTTL